jgi:hypothetical protein
MSISEKNQKAIEYFYLLKKEVDSKLDHKLTNKTHVQNYLYFTLSPVFNYAEAIIILCKENKFNAAQPLLRSLFETHINIQYYTNGDNVEKKLAIAAKAQFDWNRTVVNSFVQLISKYKNLESNMSNSVYNKIFLEKTLEHTDRERNAIIKGNHLIGKDTKEIPVICTHCKNCINSKNYIEKEDREPSTLQKAIICDTYNIEETEAGHFESMYHLVYRQLSSYTHLDIVGITSFVEKDGEGNYFFKESSDEDSLIKNSIDICVELVKDLYKHNVIDDEPSNYINEIKSITNS